MAISLDTQTKMFEENFSSNKKNLKRKKMILRSNVFQQETYFTVVKKSEASYFGLPEASWQKTLSNVYCDQVAALSTKEKFDNMA